VDWEFRTIRDPVHGYIGITELERRVIQTSVFQRLRRIKQLATSHLIYPGATHTRFEHSLGTLHVADRICQRLERQGCMEESTRQIVRLAALVHDIGHGPFSHVWDNVVLRATGVSRAHETTGRWLVSNDGEVREALGDFHEPVATLLQDDQQGAEKQAVAGPLDADKLDYLLRDSLHIGVKYGVFDLDRIVHSMTRSVEGQETDLAVTWKGQDALEGYRMALYSMYSQVYQHPMRIAGDAMLIRAVELALSEGALDAGIVRCPSSGAFNADDFLSLDDSRLYDRILRLPDGGPAKELIQRLERRALLGRGHTVEMEKVRDAKRRKRLRDLCDDAEGLGRLERQVAEAAGLQPYKVIVYPDVLPPKLYAPPVRVPGSEEESILIVQEDGTRETLAVISPFEAKRPLARETLFFFWPKEAPDKAQQEAKHAAANWQAALP